MVWDRLVHVVAESSFEIRSSVRGVRSLEGNHHGVAWRSVLGVTWQAV